MPEPSSIFLMAMFTMIASIATAAWQLRLTRAAIRVDEQTSLDQRRG